MYTEGPFLGALVSTGNETWEVRVLGNLPTTGKWSNIAIRWEPLKFDYLDEGSFNATLKEYDYDLTQMGGLQLLLNLDVIGHSLIPCVNDYDCGENTVVQVEKPFAKPTVMIGCFITSNNGRPRDFAGGTFDELAFWNHRIGDEEKKKLLGGWSK